MLYDLKSDLPWFGELVGADGPEPEFGGGLGNDELKHGVRTATLLRAVRADRGDEEAFLLQIWKGGHHSSRPVGGQLVDAAM